MNPLIDPLMNPLMEPKNTPNALRIMVVDDNLDAASTTAMLLEMYGHSVRVAHSGEMALAGARLAVPQVFLLDIGLPGIDGFELARQLRAAPETTNATLVALTGYDRAEDRQRALDAGFDLTFANR